MKIDDQQSLMDESCVCHTSAGCFTRCNKNDIEQSHTSSDARCANDKHNCEFVSSQLHSTRRENLMLRVSNLQLLKASKC